MGRRLNTPRGTTQFRFVKNETSFNDNGSNPAGPTTTSAPSSGANFYPRLYRGAFSPWRPPLCIKTLRVYSSPSSPLSIKALRVPCKGCKHLWNPSFQKFSILCQPASPVPSPSPAFLRLIIPYALPGFKKFQGIICLICAAPHISIHLQPPKH